MEYVIASCLQKKSGIKRTGYTRVNTDLDRDVHAKVKSQGITVCQDIADSLDNGSRRIAIIIDFFEGFQFRSPQLAACENCGVGNGLEDSCMDKGIPSGLYTQS
jgi:hypothetical protein